MTRIGAGWLSLALSVKVVNVEKCFDESNDYVLFYIWREKNKKAVCSVVRVVLRIQ